MEFTVKDLGSKEEKSVQEIEQQLLDKHAQEQEERNQKEQEQEQAQTQENEIELDESQIIDYIKKKHNREFNSIDELFQQSQQEQKIELPSDVDAFYKFKTETGRGIEDFLMYNRDFESMDENTVLMEYYKATEDGLDEEDIQDIISDKFSYDEDFDDEKDVRRKKTAMKKELAKAKKFLEEQKEKYKIPVESTGGQSSGVDKEFEESYKKYLEESQVFEQESAKKADVFMKKTDEVFSNFKGFEVEIGGKSFSYSPGDANEIKTAQSNLNNFLSKYIDETGYISDAKGWHKALSFAMNPDKAAAYFYELGKSESINDTNKRMKNVDLGEQSIPQAFGNTGFKVSAVSSSDSDFKIRSKK
jgi:hypothetical protein